MAAPTTPDDAPAAIRIDVGRLVDDIAALATRQEPDEPGATRRVFSDAHRAGRDWLARRMTDAGLDVQVDAGGNLIGVRAGRTGGAPIVSGSHTDTVRGGGRYDGILGVLGALEVARALDDAGVELDHDLWVVDYLGEEPNSWGLSCIGSRAVSGGLVAADLERDDGAGHPLDAALRAFGCDPDAILTATWPTPHAAVELHIEQGPVLETQGRTIGVVSGIVGVFRMLVDFSGQRDHAGTMPMDLRHDASVAAAELVLAVEIAAAGGDGVGVGTTGRIEIEPGAINVVPDRARVWVELRSIDPAWVDARRDIVVAAAEAAAERRGCRVDVSVLSAEAPTPMDDAVRAEIDAAARELGHDPLVLASGAEHDTRQIARIAPVGMIFVPSIDGRSHCPEESTSTADIESGVETLLATIVRLDRLPNGASE